MKNILMLAIVLLMTATAAFAATYSHTPKSKAKDFAGEIIKAVVDDDSEAIEEVSENMGEYVEGLGESQIEEFFTSFNEGIYYYCDYYGLGEDVAEIFLTDFYAAISKELAAMYE